MTGKNAKSVFSDAVFKVLGRAMKGVVFYDSVMRGYLAELPDDYSAVIKIFGVNARLEFGKREGEFYVSPRRKAALHGDLEIIFKNVDVAGPLLMGLKGISQAFAAHDFVMKGDICKSMVVVDMINLTECYLFPNFFVRSIMPKVLPRESNRFYIYMFLLFGGEKRA